MLRLPVFTYLRPGSVAEAIELLCEHGGQAIPVAGGTDLLPKMKRRQLEPRFLVSLMGLQELRGIEDLGSAGVTIRAGTVLSDVAGDPTIRAAFPSLAHAAASVSTPQLRNMGTIGGNLALDTRCNYYDMSEQWRRSVGNCLKADGDSCLLAPGGTRCWAVSSSDTAPILLALGARLTLRGSEDVSIIDVGDLYRDDGIDHLAMSPDELITEIHIPRPNGLRSTYIKVRRRGSFDFPIASVAVALRTEGPVVTEARIVLGGVGSRPIRATAAERLLIAQTLTRELADEVAQRAGDPAKPLDNTDLSHTWRKRMTRVMVGRALHELTDVPEAS